ncbi:LexA family protein [Cohnella sp. JJ-181]|uniref:LexA family protein n=1 Tax=Cohnella rhizoplanae TaxID=2974897 RepID=UPI0022FFAF18|nr:winged helix DNA-binding protein [Cohnella sp. JJ-181]CAI6087200.1 LexA repressor [Cohnella sp. JJ-181]
MKKVLTKKEAEALETIKSFIGRNGYSPTIRELASVLKYSSSSTVHALTDRLKEKGYLSKTEAGPRTMRVLEDLQPPVPAGFHAIGSSAVFFNPETLELVLTGTPREDDDTHSCDALGCSSVSHVIFRGHMASFTYSAVK